MRAIGEYNQLVKVLARPMTAGPTGGEVPGTPVEVAQRKAHVVPQVSRRWQQLQTVYVEMRAVFEFRQPTDIKVRDLVEHGGVRYEVVGVETYDGLPAAQSKEVTVICRGYR